MEIKHSLFLRNIQTRSKTEVRTVEADDMHKYDVSLTCNVIIIQYHTLGFKSRFSYQLSLSMASSIMELMILCEPQWSKILPLPIGKMSKAFKTSEKAVLK